jgi:hypothetical protein
VIGRHMICGSQRVFPRFVERDEGEELLVRISPHLRLLTQRQAERETERERETETEVEMSLIEIETGREERGEDHTEWSLFC